MPVKLHQPVAGMNTGETYTGPLEAWLVVNGYASDGADTNKVDVTGVVEAENPTLAANREDADATPEGVEDADNARELDKPQQIDVPHVVVGGEANEEFTKAKPKRDGRKKKVSEETPAVVTEATEAAEAAATNDALDSHSEQESVELFVGADEGDDDE